jgi:hypothetical protein
MKKRLITLFVLAGILVGSAQGQDYKTENIVLITFDGLRWQ